MTPDELINDARNYATTVTTNAVSALVGAMNTVDMIGQGVIAAETPKITLVPPVPGDPGTVPAYTGTLFEATEFKGHAPTLDNVGPVSFPSAPGAAPNVATYIDPQRPTGYPDTSLLLGVPNIDTDFTFPDPPIIDVAGIPKPVLPDLVIPPLPTFQPPEFTGTHPAAPPAPPTDLDDMMRTEYSTIMPVMRDNVTAYIDIFIDHEFPQFRSGLTQLEDRLATYLEGGTALTPAIENAIYNRTLDKTNAEADKARDEIVVKAARMGFTIPPPTLLMQLANVDKDRRDGNARAATEIAIKQAELEQNNLQFAVTQSSNLRQIMLNTAMAYFTGLVQINGQALEYARGVVDSVVKAYDIAVRYAEVQVRIYEADANVYRARLEGALALVQFYEAQIHAILAQAQVEMAQVGLYKAMLEAAQIEAQIYKTQVDVVVEQASLEKLKVDLYNSKVQAFVSQVSAYTAQWQGYAAAVSGETAKIQASGEQIKAFSARVSAYQAQVQARGIEIESRARANAQKLDAYRTEVEAYKALVDASATAVTAEIHTFDATLQSFIAKANAIAEKSKSEVSIYEVAQRGLIEASRLSFEYMRERDSMNVARATGSARIAEAIGGIYAGIAQATLAGMNSLAASTETTSA